ncbi:MAG TPA: DNA (cytosine-5-)-methyltransferase [Candidatus Dojkabacteria bacterium]|nr:DNA (cytosine-5-)-methyltransferase [Candidatus Dojkabacteria bacterium]HRO65419.1 DNA (cytosine-5-)-methyltransferase [Candidatus Dojkabacteria bacterium]HRP50701.1 DNA (cytosine-5-)-methyltransferase [Candidatus Dojkabacteria bacterium]
MEKIKVVELFAGVGGFRLGLEGTPEQRKSYHENYNTIWFNQWEPATKTQHAHQVYVNRFGNDVVNSEFTNIDVANVIDKVPVHDLLVGGFPCQDYSVARNLSASAGLEGKKGVLWWSIYKILKKQGKKAPKYLLLENVDRLLSSPASRRGRDFAIILSSLSELGYSVEWRVINAADYGMPQRRRRIFIIGYRQGSNIFNKLNRKINPLKWLEEEGVVQQSFPAKVLSQINMIEINPDPVVVSNTFNLTKPKKSPFANSGIMINGTAYTAIVKPIYIGKTITLNDIIIKDLNEISDEFFISKTDLDRWAYLKGAKNEPRKGANGYEFIYKEGAVAFPDPLDKPSRTIITSEGGSSPSRFKHVIQTPKGLRRLTPIELERLCMFPDNHTKGHSDTKRAFFMGNALVVGVIDGLGRALIKVHESS